MFSACRYQVISTPVADKDESISKASHRVMVPARISSEESV
jgi:hypothetical protein